MECLAVLRAGTRVDGDLLRSPLPFVSSAVPDAEPARALRVAVEEAERHAILRALDETGDNKTLAADRLGIGARTLQTKLKKYGL